MQTFISTFERFSLIAREKERIRRLTTNVGVSMVSFIPADSTITSKPQGARLYRAEETECSKAHTISYRAEGPNAARHTRFLTLAEIYFGAGATNASTHDNGAIRRLTTNVGV